MIPKFCRPRKIPFAIKESVGKELDCFIALEKAGIIIKENNSDWSAPYHFNFQQPQEWVRYLQRFECFRQASDLEKKSDKKQVNALIYAMGDEADGIFHLSEADAKKYKTVKARFDKYFIR